MPSGWPAAWHGHRSGNMLHFFNEYIAFSDWTGWRCHNLHLIQLENAFHSLIEMQGIPWMVGDPLWLLCNRTASWHRIRKTARITVVATASTHLPFREHSAFSLMYSKHPVIRWSENCDVTTLPFYLIQSENTLHSLRKCKLFYE